MQNESKIQNDLCFHTPCKGGYSGEGKAKLNSNCILLSAAQGRQATVFYKRGGYCAAYLSRISGKKYVQEPKIMEKTKNRGHHWH